ncbi:Uncharacterized protein FWK35_00010410, partial [Aphis craccivora]
LTVSKDEAFGNPRALRRRSPGLHAGYGHGGRGFAHFSESQATVDVATTALINRKTSARGSGDHTTPPPI